MLAGVNRGMEEADEQTSDLEDGVVEINHIEPKSCLLYTSPSPRDLSTSRMPSSA